MLSELLSMQLAFLLLFVYNRGVIKQQSGDGVGGMCDHAETIHLNVNSPVPFCCLRLRERNILLTWCAAKTAHAIRDLPWMIRKNGWLSITQGRARSIRKAGCLSVLCGTGNGTTVMMPGPVNSI